MQFDLLSNGELCRFCLSESDKSAISLKNPQILVRVDKKIIDLKDVLKFLLLNNSYSEDLPNLICNECKSIIIKYYSLKKTFLENEKTLSTKKLNHGQKIRNLISLVEEFYSTIGDEDSLKILQTPNKITIEKITTSDETLKIYPEPSNHEEEHNFPGAHKLFEKKHEEVLSYDILEEEYIQEEESTDYKTHESDTSIDEDFLSEQEEDVYEDEDSLQHETIRADSTAKNSEIFVEIPTLSHGGPENEERHDVVDSHLKEPLTRLDDKIKLKSKRKKVMLENVENGLIAKKFKVSLVDSNVIVQEDDENNSFMCSNCSAVFTDEKSANDHVMKYGKFKYCTQCKCDECSVIFSSERLFQKHKSYHILSKISSIFTYFDCVICNIGFGNEKDYEKHMSNHDGNENYAFKFEGKPQLEGCEIIVNNQKEEKCSEQDSCICGHCGMRFLQKTELNFHLTLFHANLYCPFDKQPYGKSVSYLIDHLKTKHPEQFGIEDIKFNCSHCFEEFSTKNDMREHEKYCDSKKFECDHCDKKFSLERKLKEHLEAVNGIMRFSCNFCGKNFNNKSSLTVHSRIHSKTKPYACTHPGCDKTFRTNSHRSAHMDAHNETKNFKCQYCSLMFQTRGAKRSHEKSHSLNHVCPLCQKNFKQRSHLVRHANIVHKISCGSANFEAEIERVSLQSSK